VFLLITLGVPAVLFIAFERVFPIRRQGVFRPGWTTDLCHALFDIVPLAIVLGFLHTSVGGWLRDLTPASVRDAIAAPPFVVELAIVVVVCELGMYWSHRIEHQVPFLWRFHAVHHSSLELDWLSTQRNHPVDGMVRKAFLIPMYAVGFSAACISLYLVVYYFWSFVVHANVNWRFGPLEPMIASPTFHRWHHSDERAARDTNFSPLLPAFDRVFGTWRQPEKLPASYGSDAPVPTGYVGQLAFPFRRTRTPLPS
jgi:sterol desaturase/sphingolipid hydroxylase (fatty acid hydroxylase superfamily)